MAFLRQHKPEFIIMERGAGSLAGDPLAHLKYSPAAHAHAAKSLCQLANEMAGASWGSAAAVTTGGTSRSRGTRC